MTLDLLLVNVGSTSKKIYQDLSKDYSAIEPPFWAALTAGFIRKKGFEVNILDANAENLDLKETAREIEKYDPKLTNIVVYGQQPAASTQLMGSVGKLCSEVKDINPERKIILSGLHPSALPGRTLEEERCDYVAEGEGFYTLEGLLKNGSIQEIPGLWRWQGNKIVHSPRAKNIENLTSELDDVAWDLLPWGKYKAHNWQCLDNFEARKDYASISTSLGCPFRCEFCSISATFGGEKRIRYWNTEWVLKQIDTLANKYNVRVLKIIDEMFVFNPEHFMKISEGLIERGLDLNIWAYTRIDTAKEKYLETLRKAGFRWLCPGIESGSEEIRKSVSKGKFGQEDIRSSIKRIKDADINIIGNYLIGLPEDNIESMQRTLDLALELKTEFANIYCAMAYPGSKLYSWAIKNKIKLPETWDGYSQHSYDCLPLPTKYLSAKEVLEFRDKAFNRYFTNLEYLDMTGKKFGMQAREHIEDMTKIKLKRKLLGE